MSTRLFTLAILVVVLGACAVGLYLIANDMIHDWDGDD